MISTKILIIMNSKAIISTDPIITGKSRVFKALTITSF